MDPTDKTTPRIRGNTAITVNAAYQMRHAMTPAESRLWEALRGRRLGGLRFRAQHPVGPFIVDFYCPSYKLAVELDGPVHDERAPEDAARTRQLAAHGYRVLRFRNEKVMNELESVLSSILAAVEESAARRHGED